MTAATRIAKSLPRKHLPRRSRRLRGSHRSGIFVFVFFVASVSAQAPDRSAPPKLGPRSALSLPAIQKRTLSNGLPVWIIESHDVPLAQVNVAVLSGSGDDPAGKFGVASLTAAMLDEGAGARSSLDIADVIEGLGATLTTTSSFDASAIRLSVPVARLTEALPILGDVTLRPAFPVKDLERLRQERLTALLQARDEPSSLAATAFARLLFESHRYGTSAIGTKDTVTSLTADDLRSFHAVHYVPSNAALIVVGDVRADAMLPLLERQFGGWRGPAHAAHPRTPLPAPPRQAHRRLVLVDKPGAAQSQIRVGWVGVARSTPDYFPIEVLNTVLGGSFTSRLNQNLRERHGYTYGASSVFDMRRSPGPFLAAAGVQTDKTADALREFFSEILEIRKPTPGDELTRAKNYLALGFPGEFETTGQLSRKLEELVTYGLPDDYFGRYMTSVQAVTSNQVRAAAAKHIRPAQLMVVVVGDRKVIESGLRSTRLAPVEVLTVDEVLAGK